MSEPSDPRAGQKRSQNGNGDSPGRTAEELAEEWAGRIARWTVRSLARAREEAEDVWADAQALRRQL